MLELERKGAMSNIDGMAQNKAEEMEPFTCEYTSDDGARLSASWTRSQGQKGQIVPDGRNENRCIFTPVKKARKYEQPLDTVQHLRGAREERHPSSIVSDADLLFLK